MMHTVSRREEGGAVLFDVVLVSPPGSGDPPPVASFSASDMPSGGAFHAAVALASSLNGGPGDRTGPSPCAWAESLASSGELRPPCAVIPKDPGAR